MERFVQFVVAGGLVLVAALWAAEFASSWSMAWIASLALAAVGVAAVLAGIWTRLDLPT